MTSRTDITQFLGLLARHADLIETAYHDGSVQIADETASAIRSLHAARVLSAREPGHYGLTRMMREMLDENMQHQRRFAIGGNIGGEINRMEKLLLELEEAHAKGNTEDADAYTQDLCQSLYDIKDFITRDLLQFDQIMSTRFSDVRTAEEKLRQNAHYLERTKRLQDAIEQMNRSDLHETFSKAWAGEAGRIYRSAISASISGWSASLLANSKIFEQFIFKLRSIAAETRKLRSFSRFLKEGGQGRMVEALMKADTCPAFARVSPETHAIWPDIHSDHGASAIAALTRNMKPLEARAVKERQPGKRSADRAPVVIEEDQAPEDEALSAFLSCLSEDGVWVSAATWAEAHTEVPRGLFLEHVLSWCETERNHAEHDARYIEYGAAPANHANIAIEDIEICLAA